MHRHVVWLSSSVCVLREKKRCHQAAELTWTGALKLERVGWKKEYCWIKVWTYIYHHTKYKPNWKIWKIWAVQNFNIKALWLDLKVIGKGEGLAELNLRPISIIIPNMNQIHHMVWKICTVKKFNAKLWHKSSVKNFDIKVLRSWPWP